MNEWLKTDEVALILRVHPTTVREWARTGKVKAIRYGKNWHIHRSVVEVV